MGIPGYMIPASAKSTREEAHDAVIPRKKYLRERVIGALSGAALTADEIAEQVGETPLSIRPRITELKQEGVIVPTILRRKNSSGRSATVWTIRQ